MTTYNGDTRTTSTQSPPGAEPQPGQRPDEAPLWRPAHQPPPGGDPSRTRPEVPGAPAVREVPGAPAHEVPPDGPDKERA
jgi:hypothetical protein